MRSEILALLDQGDDSTPVAYAIVNDVPLDTQKHFRKHEGIEILSYDTQGGKDFSGFDDYLGAIYEATNPLVRFGRPLEKRRILWVDPHPENKSGRIVNISSVGAFVGSVCAHPAYGVSKAGLIAMTKSLAKAYAGDGILVNAIAPGSFDTPLAAAFGEAQRQEFIEAAPLKRQGDPRELADAVFYLVSNRSTYVTGSTLHVNGGSLLI